MNQSKPWLVLGIAGLLSAPLVFADDTATDDTVTVADQGQSPDDVADGLPEQASDMANEHAVFGQGVAAQARDQARDMGRDFGQHVSSQVRQDMQQNRGSSSGHP